MIGHDVSRHLGAPLIARLIEIARRYLRLASGSGEPVPHNTTCICPSFSSSAAVVAMLPDCRPGIATDGVRRIGDKPSVIIIKRNCPRLFI